MFTCCVKKVKTKKFVPSITINEKNLWSCISAVNTMEKRKRNELTVIMCENNIAKCLVNSPCSAPLERTPGLIVREYLLECLVTRYLCRAMIGQTCLNKLLKTKLNGNWISIILCKITTRYKWFLTNFRGTKRPRRIYKRRNGLSISARICLLLSAR